MMLLFTLLAVLVVLTHQQSLHLTNTHSSSSLCNTTTTPRDVSANSCTFSLSPYSSTTPTPTLSSTGTNSCNTLAGDLPPISEDCQQVRPLSLSNPPYSPTPTTPFHQIQDAISIFANAQGKYANSPTLSLTCSPP